MENKGRFTRPDQTFAVLAKGESSESEFFPDLLQQRIVEAKEMFQCEENAGGSPGSGEVYAVWRDGIGRSVAVEG
jgi:hypothetical protein